ncbi:uncharacterized protein PGTG_20693 [Puccinia graminis f. sp. tritici CRL 75-36-700-3]|uniref:Uncharacterized protein n=1 Tax=Puccinia graminis f. sp. tritici (strain CRL 75-36-700-3 / race SCCL) TaxID=418459 RepID=H6QPE8_PUCGT|nr:uncharacterized protein PGTG_20693 [Puccinia graminis f. sp. tritici CRL 75-36-700-3]EHS63599.1 hypothetical protein PGTG_20693 [Puccinia graminis f. sp. tritici CRL 75-36-700-3]
MAVLFQIAKAEQSIGVLGVRRVLFEFAISGHLRTRNKLRSGSATGTNGVCRLNTLMACRDGSDRTQWSLVGFKGPLRHNSIKQFKLNNPSPLMMFDRPLFSGHRHVNHLWLKIVAGHILISTGATFQMKMSPWRYSLWQSRLPTVYNETMNNRITAQFIDLGVCHAVSHAHLARLRVIRNLGCTTLQKMP